jgi:hypothetical protein
MYTWCEGLTGPVLLSVLLLILHGHEDWVGQLTPAQRSPTLFKATTEEVASADAALESFTCNHGGTVQAFNLPLPCPCHKHIVGNFGCLMHSNHKYKAVWE